MEVLSRMKTSYLLEIPEDKYSSEVTLYGYLGNRVDLSKRLSFVPLLSQTLDRSVQIVSSSKGQPDIINRIAASHQQLKRVEAHSPVVVTGILKSRQGVPEREIGQVVKVELALLDIQPLNDFHRDFGGSMDDVFGTNDRHLQLRSDKDLRDSLGFRSLVARTAREEMDNQEFMEIETPLLFRSTPEGAREFIVPTRRQGFAYALPQSPQQFKQILMGSGISKYYQVAKCFRDEDLRADRQPEFTQLDMEMSFATGTTVRKHITKLVRKLWDTILEIRLPSVFREMRYAEAMSLFGSDKPDLRFEWIQIYRVEHLLPTELVSKLSDLENPIIEALRLDLESSNEDDDAISVSQAFIKSFLDSSDAASFHSNPSGAPGVFVYNPLAPLRGLSAFGFEAASAIESILSPKEGSIIILQARPKAPLSGGSTALGNLRSHLIRAALQRNLLKPEVPFAPVWITCFPLFTPTSSSAAEPGQGGTAGLSSTHHPFTAPKSPEDVDLLLTSPQDAIADHYDLVINGVELGGGSRRIHNADFQTFILRDVLKMSEARLKDFEHLIKVLKAGCPPHAGFALGFDRLVALMRGKESVRDVIAFPKGGDGGDKLVGSPARMREEELRTYGLELKPSSGTDIAK
ncbi:MAG: hypothetical protein Q9195_008190 [Heterodermia aff. obscurata]